MAPLILNFWLEWEISEFRPLKVSPVPAEYEFGREGESHSGGFGNEKIL